MAEKQALLGDGAINSGHAAAVDGEVAPPPRKQRLISLDAVRGLTVAVMIFVDDTGSVLNYINHSPWDNITFADFVMPFFLFMVGVSMSLSFRKHKKGLLWKVLKRTVKLFVLGLLTQGAHWPGAGSYGFDLKRIRVPGILQRIAFAYLVVSLMAMYLPKLTTGFRWRDARFADVPQATGPQRAVSVFRFLLPHWLVALAFLGLYAIVMRSTHVASYSYFDHKANTTWRVPCDVVGDLSPACNAGRATDLWLMGWDHQYPHPMYIRSKACSSCSPSKCPRPDAPAWCHVPQDPEGTLATLPTVLTTAIGLHFGVVLQCYKAHSARLWQWVPLSLFLLLVGGVIHMAGWKMNKQLWSPSFVFFMAGCNGFVLALYYALLDFKAWQPRWMQRKAVRISDAWSMCLTDVFRPLVWVGMNTFFVYLMAAADVFEAMATYVWWDRPENNLVDASYSHIFCHKPVWDRRMEPEEMHSFCTGGIFKGHLGKWARVTYVLCKISFWVVVAGILHFRRWYWTL